MRRTLTAIAVAGSALALSGCILPPPTPQQQFVAEATGVLDDAGAIWPERDPGVSEEQALLELGEGLCTARESAGRDAMIFGITGEQFLDGMGGMALAALFQIERAAADEVMTLARVHLCPESGE